MRAPPSVIQHQQERYILCSPSMRTSSILGEWGLTDDSLPLLSLLIDEMRVRFVEKPRCISLGVLLLRTIALY